MSRNSSTPVYTHGAVTLGEWHPPPGPYRKQCGSSPQRDQSKTTENFMVRKTFKLKDKKTFTSALIEYYNGLLCSDGDDEVDDYRDEMRPIFERELAKSKYLKIRFYIDRKSISLMDFCNKNRLDYDIVAKRSEAEAQKIFLKLMTIEVSIEKWLRQKYKIPTFVHHGA